VNDHHSAYLDQLLHCLEKVVAYYKVNYASMNLDGIYGLRILEGQSFANNCFISLIHGVQYSPKLRKQLKLIYEM
jgi:hypothetical protein